jgi:hypothetical protein
MSAASNERPTWADVIRKILGDCIEHAHEQVGGCVYCAQCNRRLYQGEVMSLEDRTELRVAMEQED